MSTFTMSILWRPPTDPNLSKFMEKNDYDSLTRYLVGNNYRFRENIIIPRILGPVIIKTNEEKMIESTIESCPFKSVTSCVIGKFCSFSIYNFCLSCTLKAASTCLANSEKIGIYAYLCMRISRFFPFLEFREILS